MLKSQGTPMHSILALIPAYNEGERIARVVVGARDHLPVLVVDDGSTDDTAERAEEAGATVLRQTPNRGKGATLQAGFRYALSQGYAATVTLDADGQHDPAEIPKFLEAYAERRTDLIIGARDFRQIPGIRRYSNALGQWLFTWALGQSVPDNQSGYRLISRRLMEATLESRETGFHFEVDMIVICVQYGFSLEALPIRTIYAGEKSHIDPLDHLIHFTRMIWQTRQRMRRAQRNA
jgi:glycosyltransferase involved in cell wall biosynthesis